MKGWKMTAADFYDLLIKKQDYRCYLSGQILTPDSVRIVKISLDRPVSEANVCLVHEIVAPMARKWSISDIRRLCVQIAQYSEGGILVGPEMPKIRTKSAWHISFDRISNFNQKRVGKTNGKVGKSLTWGKSSEDQIRNINRTS